MSANCKSCGAEIGELEVFPGGICLKCHAERFDRKLALSQDKAAFWSEQKPDFKSAVRLSSKRDKRA